MDSFERITETFKFFEDWEDRYHYLTEIGQRLPALPQANRDDSPTPLVTFRADSDTPVIKGILAILLAIYSGKSTDDIDGIDADGIFAQLGIYDHLSPNRHVGVYAMMEKMRAIAKTTARMAA